MSNLVVYLCIFWLFFSAVYMCRQWRHLQTGQHGKQTTGGGVPFLCSTVGQNPKNCYNLGKSQYLFQGLKQIYLKFFLTEVTSGCLEWRQNLQEYNCNHTHIYCTIFLFFVHSLCSFSYLLRFLSHHSSAPLEK